MNPNDLGGNFRQAMRRLAASVHIVATRSEGRNYGLTATSVTSLSMAPPALLVCVNQNTAAHPVLARPGQIFSVNLLTPEQQDAASLFGTSSTDGSSRFAPGCWENAEEGVPVLIGASSNVLCEVDALHPYGSHTIFIGRVLRVSLGNEATPLIYVNGNYSKLGQHEPIPAL